MGNRLKEFDAEQKSANCFEELIAKSIADANPPELAATIITVFQEQKKGAYVGNALFNGLHALRACDQDCKYITKLCYNLARQCGELNQRLRNKILKVIVDTARQHEDTNYKLSSNILLEFMQLVSRKTYDEVMALDKKQPTTEPSIEIKTFRVTMNRVNADAAMLHLISNHLVHCN